jgi:hypothetical protein
MDIVVVVGMGVSGGWGTSVSCVPKRCEISYTFCSNSSSGLEGARTAGALDAILASTSGVRLIFLLRNRKVRDEVEICSC